MPRSNILPDYWMNPNEIFHRNIIRLLIFYPAKDEFNNILKQEMFNQPNRNGFFEVVNYLNCIIDIKKWQSLIVWPVLTRKDEGKFRKAVRTFTVDLNSSYPSNIVPILEPSVLLAPQGIKIVRFLMKLSDYALRKLMAEKLGCKNALESLNVKHAPITSNGRAKLAVARALENIQTSGEELKLCHEFGSCALQTSKSMQNQLSDLIASNNEKKRELNEFVAGIVNDDVRSGLHKYMKGKEIGCLEQWTSNLNKQFENALNSLDYLKAIEHPLDNCHKLAKIMLEKKSDNLILDGQKLLIPSSSIEGSSVPSLTSFLEYSTKLPTRLSSLLESGSPLPLKDTSELEAAVQKLHLEMTQELDGITLLEEKSSNELLESQRSIKELEELVLSPEVFNDCIPSAVLNYAKTPPFKLGKPRNVKSLIPPPTRENLLQSWLESNFFKKLQPAHLARNTPVKHDCFQHIPKKTVKKMEGLEDIPEKNVTPSKNIGPKVTPPNQEANVSIELPVNLSMSTMSPCSDGDDEPADFLGGNEGAGDIYRKPAPALSTRSDSTSILSPSKWKRDVFNSTPFVINNYVSNSSSDNDHHPASSCRQSSPSRAIQPLSYDVNETNKRRKMRPSLEKLISRSKALMRRIKEESSVTNE